MDRREYITQTALMLGYTLTFGTVASVMESCKSEKNHLNDVGVDRPKLSKSQFNLLAELCETIIPRTDTPGAKDTKIPEFVEKMMREVFEEKDYKEFIKGLTEIDEECRKNMGKSFLDCNQAEREKFLTKLDNELPKFPPTMWGIVLLEKPEPTPFFRKLKAITLMGYFTSKELAEFNKGKAVHG